MACTCGSNRIVNVTGKTSDLCFISYEDLEHDGYVPSNLNIGGGDYLEFSMCLDCGRIQGKFPITDEALHKEIAEA